MRRKTPLKSSYNIAWIVVATHRMLPLADVLIKSLVKLRIPSLSIYLIKVKEGRDGYAHGVNLGICNALADSPKYFIISNPDIAVSPSLARQLLAPSKHFDVWGYAMKQQGVMYYGGAVDQWRMSGGLVSEKPDKRFAPVDFVSGSLMGFAQSVVDTIGTFDEQYGMYYEDTDFCTRAKLAGLSVGIDRDRKYDHFETSSKSRYRERKELALALGRLRYFLKYADVQNMTFEIARLPLTLWEYRRLIKKHALPALGGRASRRFKRIFNFVRK